VCSNKPAFTASVLHGLVFLQLYNEDINDLLAPDNLKLPIHESKESGVYVAGLREDIVVSVEQVMQLLSEGEANRHIGATKMNEGSSRSHTVFRMVSIASSSASGLAAKHSRQLSSGQRAATLFIVWLTLRQHLSCLHFGALSRSLRAAPGT
jgi:hypothetical protein